jgi:tetratricopeptide (TPR) repeat protein
MTDRALEWHERTLAACPYSVHHRLTRMELLAAAGLRTEALADSETLEDLLHAPSLFRLGSLDLKLGQPQTALFWANTLMRQFPDDYRGFLLSAIVERSHNRWRQFQRNIEIAQRLALHAPVLREHQATWEAYQGRYSEADRILREQMQPDPDAAELWSTLAQMILREQPSQASRWFQTAVETWLARKSPAAASRVLVTYAETLDPEEGKSELKRVVVSLKALPELHPEALVFLSRYEASLDRHAPSVLKYLEAAVRLAPCNPEYRMRLGNLLIDVDRARAEEQFQKILTLRPTSLTEQAKERLQKLQREAPPTQAIP